MLARSSLRTLRGSLISCREVRAKTFGMSLVSRLKASLEDFQRNRLKVANLAGVRAVQHLEKLVQEQARNQAAEGAWVRKHVWGEDGSSVSPRQEDEEVGHTVVGDVTASPPIVFNNPSSNSGPVLAALALGMIPLVGLGGAGLTYLFMKDKPPPVIERPNYQDSTFDIGLGQIEDLER